MRLLRLVHVSSLLVGLAACASRLPAPASPERVTITRDDWGIAHVHGHSDADAVFGMIYAQAEDDFNRVETNYLVALGRLAEAEGEAAIWQDLRQRLYVSDDRLRALYADSPPWLKGLLQAWAAGLNHYLATHPQVQPRVLRHFEPWMALSFTEGSIGGDIERISLPELASFYGGTAPEPRASLPEWLRLDRAGSNGIAIAPQNTAGGRTLLLINPHTSFFFRSELQMTSDEGLDVYGAVTWGQFFVYQGWNDRVAWMHTSSGVDSVDEFLETVVERGGRRFYRHGAEERPVETSTVTVRYRTPAGALASRAFTVYRTHHGPIVRAKDGRWVSFAMMDKPIAALSQSFELTKARNLGEFLRVMERKANSSNNTVYADADGVIAYLHPQFVPRRDDRFDYRQPVDGADPATDWQGEHALSDLPQVIAPPNGWLQNTNDWPYSTAGAGRSPAPERYPRYMDGAGENARGLHAMALLEGKRDFTIERLRAAAFDPAMPGFARVIPRLIESYDRAPASHALKAKLAEAVAVLRGWDDRWSADSIATTLAVTWGEEMLARCDAAKRAMPPPVEPPWDPDLPLLSCLSAPGADERRLEALASALDKLTAAFGGWRMPWGEINRFQRVNGAIRQPFDDAAESTPVPFTPGVFGSLASFAVDPKTGGRRRYGTTGNSFVAIVELGPGGVKAVAVNAGGASGDPSSPHFKDQAERYAAGDLRPVYFYPRDLAGHTERVYKPGDAAHSASRAAVSQVPSRRTRMAATLPAASRMNSILAAGTAARPNASGPEGTSSSCGPPGRWRKSLPSRTESVRSP